MRPTTEPIGLAVTRHAKTISRAFDEALTSQGSNLATWLVLVSLTGGERRAQRSIAADVGIDGATLTHHLHRLEQAGLVARVRNPQDKRIQHVSLTEAGTKQFQGLLGTVQAFDERLRADFTDDELATLRQLLGRLAANATDSAGDPTNERSKS